MVKKMPLCVCLALLLFISNLRLSQDIRILPGKIQEIYDQRLKNGFPICHMKLINSFVKLITKEEHFVTYSIIQFSIYFIYPLYIL